MAIEVEMIDIQVPPHHDLTRERLETLVKQNSIWALLCSAPESTLQYFYSGGLGEQAWTAAGPFFHMPQWFHQNDLG